MGEFVFIKYVGSDAGEVLVTMLSQDDEDQVHEIETHTERRVGFMPNPEEDDDEEEGDDDEDDD